MKIIRCEAVWCSGCLVMQKVWKKIEEKYPMIEMVRYDYDFDAEKIEEYHVGDLLPVTIFIGDKGEELARLQGEKTAAEIEKIIEEYR